MRTITSLSFVLAIFLSAEGRADGASGAPPTKAAKPSRPMRTLKVDGGFIRYEVLPEDAQSPPGELFFIATSQPGHARSSEPRYGDVAQRDEAPAQKRRDRARPASDKCRDAQAKLAVRYFELEGLDVPPDLALWLQDHPSFFSELQPGAGSYIFGPTMAALVQRDQNARIYAEELARCEAANRQR